MSRILFLLLMLLTVVLPTRAMSAGMAEYLILQDIGNFKLSVPEKSLPGEPPIGGPSSYVGAVVVDGASHFDQDHTDTTYEVDYFDFSETYPSPTVQVTQHAGADSDKWLLHEVEESLRSADVNKLGRRSESAAYRRVGTADILTISIAGRAYYWLSNNVTVHIDYSDSKFTKPEPIEVVQAYLNKFPPTLPPDYKRFNTATNDIVWIKDEIERRLWLCDKWFGLVVADDPNLGDKLGEVVDSMNIFLDYREKYYGIVAEDEKLLLEKCKKQKDETTLRAKLTEYKKWWADNKTVAISLTTIPFSQKVKNWWWHIVGFFKNIFRRVHRLVAA